MARATDLPIYREAYDLLQLVTKLAQQFPRGYRQGLARDLSAEAQAVVKFIFRANCTRDKVEIIEQLRERLESLRLFLRLSFDLRLIPPGPFGATVELTDAVGKQAAGWLNYARGRV